MVKNTQALESDILRIESQVVVMLSTYPLEIYVFVPQVIIMRFLKNMFIGYNSHTIKFTYLQYIGRWFKRIHRVVQPSPPSILEYVHHPQKKPPAP